MTPRIRAQFIQNHSRIGGKTDESVAEDIEKRLLRARYVLELGRNKFDGPAAELTGLEKVIWV